MHAVAHLIGSFVWDNYRLGFTLVKQITNLLDWSTWLILFIYLSAIFRIFKIMFVLIAHEWMLSHFHLKKSKVLITLSCQCSTFIHGTVVSVHCINFSLFIYFDVLMPDTLSYHYWQHWKLFIGCIISVKFLAALMKNLSFLKLKKENLTLRILIYICSWKKISADAHNLLGWFG